MRSLALCETPHPVRLLGQGTIFYSQTQHSGQHNTDIIYERALATGWNPQGRNAQSYTG